MWTAELATRMVFQMVLNSKVSKFWRKFEEDAIKEGKHIFEHLQPLGDEYFSHKRSLQNISAFILTMEVAFVFRAVQC